MGCEDGSGFVGVEDGPGEGAGLLVGVWDGDVGAEDGLSDWTTEGENVGDTVVGLIDGERVVGLGDGTRVVGLGDGTRVVGLADGARVVGLADGTRVVGLADGARVVGLADGARVVGLAVGARVVGLADGAKVVGLGDGAKVVGLGDGGLVGSIVGASVDGPSVGNNGSSSSILLLGLKVGNSEGGGEGKAVGEGSNSTRPVTATILGKPSSMIVWFKATWNSSMVGALKPNGFVTQKHVSEGCCSCSRRLTPPRAVLATDWSRRRTSSKRFASLRHPRQRPRIRNKKT